MTELNGKKIALCITVYKHRTNSLLAHLNEIRKDIDIYIVAQNNDPALSEYNQYCVDSNIHIMNTSATSIFEKREAIRMQTSEMGYDYYFMVDDDMHFRGWKISPETKRTTSDSYKKFAIPFNELLDRCISVIFETGAGFVSPAIEHYIGFSKPGEISINKGIHCGAFILVDIHQIDAADIHYDTTGEVHEDVDFMYKLLKNKIKCVGIKDYAFSLNNAVFNKSTNASTIYTDTEELYMFVINQYVRWHWPISLTGNDFLVMRIPYNHLWGNEYCPKADETLLELCKTKDVHGVINYLKSKKNKK